MSEISAADFTPLKAGQETQAISRPSLSYWQDAWIRLKANTRALISLYIVIGLLAFTLVGPLLWSVDPCLLYTSPSPRDQRGSRMPSSA